MLRVHRQQLTLPGQCHHELAAHDEGLLVREGKPLSRLQRGDRGTQTRRTHKGIENHIGVRQAGKFNDGSVARANVHGQRKQCSRVSRGGFVGQGDMSHAELTACRTTRSALLFAAKATIWTRSGLSRATESACVPIEPVDPRTATRSGRVT